MWLVEWLYPKVIPGEGKRQDEDRPTRLYFWRVLGPIARVWSRNSKIPQDQSIHPYHGLILSWYHGWPLRNKRVIKKHASIFMTPKISKSWKFEILLAHDQSEPVQALILMNFVRWREFHCRAAFHVSFHVIRKVVSPNSNTGTGQTSRRRPADPMVLLACSRSDCSRMKP